MNAIAGVEIDAGLNDGDGFAGHAAIIIFHPNGDDIGFPRRFRRFAIFQANGLRTAIFIDLKFRAIARILVNRIGQRLGRRRGIIFHIRGGNDTGCRCAIGQTDFTIDQHITLGRRAVAVTGNRGDDGKVIFTGNGEGQRCRVGLAVPITHRIGEDFGDGLTLFQRVIGDGIAVRAVFIQGQCAVITRKGEDRAALRGGGAIGCRFVLGAQRGDRQFGIADFVFIIDQHIAGFGGVHSGGVLLINRLGIVKRDRHTILRGLLAGEVFSRLSADSTDFRAECRRAVRAVFIFDRHGGGNGNDIVHITGAGIDDHFFFGKRIGGFFRPQSVNQLGRHFGNFRNLRRFIQG